MNQELQDIQLACFCLGDTLFSVDIMRIKEILQMPRLSSLPTPSRFLEGVINLRGTVIPVMNLRKRFGMASTAVSESSKLLIVSLSRQLLALAVDDVRDVITVPVSEIKPPPEIESGLGAECIVGVCLVDEIVYMVLGVDTLIGDDPSFVSCSRAHL